MKPEETIEYTLSSDTTTDKLYTVLIKVDTEDKGHGMTALRRQMESVRQESVKAKNITDAAYIVAEQIEPLLKETEEVVAIKKETDTLYG